MASIPQEHMWKKKRNCKSNPIDQASQELKSIFMEIKTGKPFRIQDSASKHTLYNEYYSTHYIYIHYIARYIWLSV